MPARRELKILRTTQAAVKLVRDAEIGGLGLDFARVPDVLGEAGRAEWSRLAEVFASEPARFREGDRAAVTSYCAWWAAYAAAQADVRDRGPVVEGRSARDRGRIVKNPATVAAREASTQLRYWARELGLTPDSRSRMGLADTAPAPDAEPNPFA